MSTYAEMSRQRAESFIASLPQDVQQTVTEAMQRLLDSSEAGEAKGVGDQAPDFTLPGAGGGNISLAELLARGPVVLSFYRGGWCPFCDLEFKALHDKLEEITNAGATLIGVAPETIENTIQTKNAKDIQFELCSDEGNRVANEYGLVITVDEALRPLYLEWGINIPEANGDDSYRLPVPATYVIDSSGRIRAAHVDKDYTRRMEPDAIVAALHAL